MSKELSARRTYLRWITISSFATVFCLLAAILMIAVYIVNFRPGRNIVFYRDVLKSLLLIHGIGLAIPICLIAHSITRSPPYQMQDKFENGRLLARLFGVLTSSLFAIALIAAAFTCKTIYVNELQIDTLFKIAACLQPFVWLSLGACLYQFRKTLEARGKTYAGIAAIAFIFGGVAIMGVVATLIYPSIDLGILTLLIPPLATGLLFVGLVSMFLALLFVRREITNYFY